MIWSIRIIDNKKKIELNNIFNSVNFFDFELFDYPNWNWGHWTIFGYRFHKLRQLILKKIENLTNLTIMKNAELVSMSIQNLKFFGKLKFYEESVVDKFKSNLLLMIFWLHIINYNSKLIKLECWCLRLINFLIKTLAWHAD